MQIVCVRPVVIRRKRQAQMVLSKLMGFVLTWKQKGLILTKYNALYIIPYRVNMNLVNK